MCGIATIAIGDDRRGRISYPQIREITKELLDGLQNRGIDASGIAVINRPGTASRVFKKPLRPTRFTQRPYLDNFLEELVGPETNFIMVHARATTRGNTSDNRNNHPIIADPIVGIHNGTLYNDKSLFKKYRLPQEGTVDSEVIFRLYYRFVTHGMSPKDAINQVSKNLQGAYTGALVDTRDVRKMVMFRRDRSLCLIRIPHIDTVITVSEARFFDDAAKQVGMTAERDTSYVEDGTGILFDMDKPGKMVDTVEDFELDLCTKGSGKKQFSGVGVS